MKYAHTKVELRSENCVHIWQYITPFNELLLGIAIYVVRSRYIYIAKIDLTSILNIYIHFMCTKYLSKRNIVSICSRTTFIY